MTPQETVLITILGAFTSLVFSVISFFIFRGVKKSDENEKAIRDDSRGEIEKLWKEIRLLKESLGERILEGEEKGSTLRREIYARLRSLEARREACRDMFLGRMEWKEIESIKEKSMEDWKDQNRRLEATIRSMMELMKKSLNGMSGKI